MRTEGSQNSIYVGTRNFDSRCSHCQNMIRVATLSLFMAYWFGRNSVHQLRYTVQLFAGWHHVVCSTHTHCSSPSWSTDLHRQMNSPFFFAMSPGGDDSIWVWWHQFDGTWFLKLFVVNSKRKETFHLDARDLHCEIGKRCQKWQRSMLCFAPTLDRDSYQRIM